MNQKLSVGQKALIDETKGFAQMQAMWRFLNYHEQGEVKHKGRRARQWIGSCDVTITRPGKPKAYDAEGKRVAPVKGDPFG